MSFKTVKSPYVPLLFIADIWQTEYMISFIDILIGTKSSVVLIKIELRTKPMRFYNSIRIVTRL